MSVPALLSIYNRLTLLAGDQDPDKEPNGEMHLADLEAELPLGPLPEPKFKCIMGSAIGLDYFCTFFFVDYESTDNLELEIVLEYDDSGGVHKFYTVFDKSKLAVFEASAIGKIYNALKEMMTKQDIIRKQKIIDIFGRRVVVKLTFPIIHMVDDLIYEHSVSTKTVYPAPETIIETAVSDFDQYNTENHGTFNYIRDRFVVFNVNFENGSCHFNEPDRELHPGPPVIPDEAPVIPG